MNMIKSIVKLLIIFTLLVSSNLVMAHPGRTDTFGGHTCYTNCEKWGLSYGEYHYHTPKVISTPTPTKAPKVISKPIIKPSPTPKNIVLKVGTFTLGSSKEQVKKVMGTPDSASAYAFWYGYSIVTFSNGVVSQYSQGDVPLKVHMGYKNTSAPAFTIGSTRAQVIAAMGTPDSASTYAFWYGYSIVTFSNGVVSQYSQGDVPLKVR